MYIGMQLFILSPKRKDEGPNCNSTPERGVLALTGLGYQS